MIQKMNIKSLVRYSTLVSAVGLVGAASSLLAQSPVAPTVVLQSAIDAAADNRAAIERALAEVPDEQAAGMQFLIENMPVSDLQSLSAEFLLEHVKLAYEARKQAKWGAQIPESEFLNNVLPYANVNERRDNVRHMLRERFWPVVKDLDSITQAAAKLNQEVFRELSVKYSTKRRRADQGVLESVQSGLASCTGLSILLIDACRSCGIPARFVGTPLWSDGSGNHSWVEIWDDSWHFTGAAEPTGDELDKAWFVGRASKATMGDPTHGIFAVSFRKTSIPFPLVWARFGRTVPEVYAVDVTERYAKPQPDSQKGLVELKFRALGPTGLDRCQANLVIKDPQGEIVFRGQTKNESSDANDHLTTRLKPGNYMVELTTNESGLVSQRIEVGEEEKLITLRAADEVPSAEAPPTKTLSTETPPADTPPADTLPADTLPADTPPADAPPAETSHADAPRAETQRAETQPAGTPVAELTAWLHRRLDEEPPMDWPALLEQPFATTPLKRAEAAEAAEILAREHERMIRATRAQEHADKKLVIDGLEMKYDYTVFGDDKPTSLVISMHGGGGAPTRVNERQWENQKKLYKLESGIYLAPRAPTDTWNLWHQPHIDTFFTRLIENMIAFEGVDSDRVYITGYSAGGDGVFQLAPRMADQLAAAAMMAGHPNETRPDGLRNLPFTLHMGEQDAAYNRNEKASEWKKLLGNLQQADPAGYQHWVEIHAGKGHWMGGEDAAGVEWMFQFTRKLIPEKVVWLQDDVLHPRFYWLAVRDAQAAPRQRVVASRQGNTFTIEHCDTPEITFLLRDDMLDLAQPITVIQDGREIFTGQAQRTIADLVRTLVDRGDPKAMFSASLSVRPTSSIP